MGSAPRRARGVTTALVLPPPLVSPVSRAATRPPPVDLLYEIGDGDVLCGAAGRLMADWTLRTTGLVHATGGAAGGELALPGMLTATFGTRGARRCSASASAQPTRPRRATRW